eukprot:CAMPEP_0114695316 /NCGR_PEP_ID=MMETSP0191-20121206/71227_1 /TAXON_ID=126664 /ORGANISM="Sorites sp." /LENGTH=220 /DNA_ID=CAMNT_0001991419 /DNA_START=133 /DNA_END=792 /DNA_ORIENTATION=+
MKISASIGKVYFMTLDENGYPDAIPNKWIINMKNNMQIIVDFTKKETKTVQDVMGLKNIISKKYGIPRNKINLYDNEQKYLNDDIQLAYLENRELVNKLTMRITGFNDKQRLIGLEMKDDEIDQLNKDLIYEVRDGDDLKTLDQHKCVKDYDKILKKNNVIYLIANELIKLPIRIMCYNDPNITDIEIRQQANIAALKRTILKKISPEILENNDNNNNDN